MFTALLIAAGLSVVDKAARQQHFHGVVRVERDGRVLVEKGYGVPASTAFWVASISKSFTAALILRLQEQGKVTLQDAVGDLTIDELLTHTSGLPRSTYVAEQFNDPEVAEQKILAQPRRPRGKFAYTNDGYSLLAIVAQREGGAPFFELVQRKVLDPAGLHQTGFWPRCFKGAHVAKLTKFPGGRYPTKIGASRAQRASARPPRICPSLSMASIKGPCPARQRCGATRREASSVPAIRFGPGAPRTTATTV